MKENGITRRGLLAGAGAMAALPAAASAATKALPKLKAVAFDAFAILDARPIAALADSFWGVNATRLVTQWSAKLFGYTWLETAAGRYSGFEAIADAALRQTADALALPLSETQRRALIAQYGKLDAWPDVHATLARLRSAGLRLAFLSNLSEDLLRANTVRNGLDALLEPPLSTDRVRRFKPAAEAYALGETAFGAPRSEIGFAAFAGWDAVGAQWFGYPTCWVNRAGQPAETLGNQIAFMSKDMASVLQLTAV